MSSKEKLRQALNEHASSDVDDQYFDIALDVFATLYDDAPLLEGEIADRVHQDNTTVTTLLSDAEQADLIADAGFDGYELTDSGRELASDLAADRSISRPEPDTDPSKSTRIHWEYQMEQVRTSPAIADGTLFVGGGDNVHAVDMETGDREWTGQVARSYETPQVGPSMVYVKGPEYIHALDKTTGETEWTFDISDTRGPNDIPAPTVANGLVYIAKGDEVYGIDPNTDTIEWRRDNESGRNISSMTEVEDTLVTATDSGSFQGLDADTGEELWTFRISTVDHQPATAMMAGRSRNSPLTASGHTVFVNGWGPQGFGSDSHGHVYAIDAVSGELEWEFETDAPIESAPAVAGETVFAGDTNSTVYALNAETGSCQWNTTTAIAKGPTIGEKGTTDLVASNGTVYVGSDFRNLYALAAQSGDLLWLYETEGRTYSPVAENGMVYLVDKETSTLYAVSSTAP